MAYSLAREPVWLVLQLKLVLPNEPGQVFAPPWLAAGTLLLANVFLQWAGTYRPAARPRECNPGKPPVRNPPELPTARWVRATVYQKRSLKRVAHLCEHAMWPFSARENLHLRPVGQDENNWHQASACHYLTGRFPVVSAHPGQAVRAIRRDRPQIRFLTRPA